MDDHGGTEDQNKTSQTMVETSKAPKKMTKNELIELVSNLQSGLAELKLAKTDESVYQELQAKVGLVHQFNRT